LIRPFAGLLDPRAAAPLWLAGEEGGGRGEFVCLLDGAIHNRAELAADLGLPEGEGIAAVLVAAYRRWGIAAAARLRGEFTLLLWDPIEGRGLLIPDQLGTHRVFYRRDGGRLWFATEVVDLLALLPTRPAPDPAAVSRWLTARAAADGATLYAGIECLGPGHLLELDRRGATERRYWQPTYREPLAVDRVELDRRVGAALESAVARRVTPGAPLGVLMSGGLDSTSVAVLAQAAAADGTITFSALFPDHPLIDESPWIDALTDATGIANVGLAAGGGGILASGLEYLDRWQLPLHAWSEAWVQPLLGEAAALGVEAMLSGEGGDELFGSRLSLTADLLRAGRLIAAVRFVHGLPEAGGRAPRHVVLDVLRRFGLAGLPSARAERAWRALAPGADVPAWADPTMRSLLRSGAEPSWRELDGPRWWAALVSSLTEGVHAFGILDHLRRRTVQRGLEARFPLLDLDLFELLSAVPPQACSEGDLTRPLLRRAMAGRSPDPVRLRPDKSVFDGVVDAALRGPELAALRRLLGGRDAEVRAYARPQALAAMLDRPPGPRDPAAGQWADDLLRLAAVEVWLRSQGDPELPRRLLDSSFITTSPKPGTG
jgi:asparagine synthase (glutamine-hydrolysing)